MLSRHSESDLCRINKTKTFQERNELPFDTGDVLARVVRALGNITVDDDDNPDVIRDTDTITSVISEKSNDHDEYSVPPTKPRLRAASAYRKPSIVPVESPHKWTWNGTNAQIQEFRNMRHQLNIEENVLIPNKSTACSIKIDEPNKATIQPMNANKLNPVIEIEPAQKLNVGIHPRRYSIVGQECLLPKAKTASRIGYIKPKPSSRRPSIFEIQENEADKSLLETTTIADLIRVLEVAHTINNSCNDPAFQELLGIGPMVPPKRLEKRRASMYPRSEHQPLRQQHHHHPHHYPLLNGNFIARHDDHLRSSKPDYLNDFAERQFSILPNNPSRRSSITNGFIGKQRRQSMRPNHWSNNCNDATEVTGRFTVSKRLRPTNSFRMKINRRSTVQSSQNSLSELNEKSDDKIV